MAKIIVFSDPHMVAEGERIIGIDPYARLRDGLAHADRHHPDAACVVVVGDLTDRGDVASYHRVAELLERSAAPCHLLLGNHDRRAAFFEVFPQAPRGPNGFAQEAFDLAGYRLLLLDTLDETAPNGTHDHAGRLDGARLAWLDAELAAAAGRPAVVFMHHPPHAVGFTGMDSIRLRDEDAFYAVLAKHGNVRHIVAAHIHRTISGSCRGIPFSVFKSPTHQQPMDFASTDTSLSVAEPPAYGIILLGGTSILVHTEDYELPPAA